MSREIWEQPEYLLTEFSGGKDGIMLQLTPVESSRSGAGGYVALTPGQADKLAARLRSWSAEATARKDTPIRIAPWPRWVLLALCLSAAATLVAIVACAYWSVR